MGENTGAGEMVRGRDSTMGVGLPGADLSLVGSPMSSASTESALDLQPGRVVGLIGPPGMGMTRVGLGLLAGTAGGAPLVYVDTRGWISPAAAWEMGIDAERLIVVRCDEPTRWGQVTAALLEGVPFVYAEVPDGVGESVLRRLGALARARRASLMLRPVRGDVPSGIAHLRLRAVEVEWEGADRGHGRLHRRRMVLEASGRAVAGIERLIEVEDDGTHVVHLVSGLAAPPSGRAVG